MELSYIQKKSYNIICDPNGYCSLCNIITVTEIYGDKVFLASSTSSEEYPFEKMKKVIEELKMDKD